VAEAAGQAGLGGSAAPYARYRIEVREELIDYNGHLYDAGYAIVLSEANEMLFADLGLSEAYRVATGRALYTVESHIRYLAESRRGDVLAAESLLVSADPKRLRVHTLLSRADGTAVATGEHLYLHVDEAAGGVTAMPADRWTEVEALLSAHASLPRPAHLGLGVGAPRPRG
jgi:acyl-CoA thioesterase FadM